MCDSCYGDASEGTATDGGGGESGASVYQAQLSMRSSVPEIGISIDGSPIDIEAICAKGGPCGAVIGVPCFDELTSACKKYLLIAFLLVRSTKL